MTKGVLTCEVKDGLYILAPGSSLWIPAGIEHSIRGAGPLETYCLYLNKKYTKNLPETCVTMTVSQLLKVLILKCTEISAQETLTEADTRMCRVLIDQLAVAPIENMHLPLPDDQRLKGIADLMASKPSERLRVDDWAQQIGISERTLSRLMLNQTGMTFGRWRQQLHISLALQWLAEGNTVHQIAVDLGYESASSFVAMFKKVMGNPPVKYLTGKTHK